MIIRAGPPSALAKSRFSAIKGGPVTLFAQRPALTTAKGTFAMAKAGIPTPELLRQLFRYEPETGALFWCERTPDMFEPGNTSAEHNCRTWNSRHAGKQAGRIDSKGYRYTTIFNRNYRVHRIIWAMIHNANPLQIDHIDGQRTNNRLANLREVTVKENRRNQRVSRRNSSGVTGVHWCARDKRWTSQIKNDGKAKHLGNFTNFEDAVASRKRAERELGFHPNHGRN